MCEATRSTILNISTEISRHVFLLRLKNRNGYVFRGVIQRDVFSTTLFIIYLDGLLERIQNLGKGVQIYADRSRVAG